MNQQLDETLARAGTHRRRAASWPLAALSVIAAAAFAQDGVVPQSGVIEGVVSSSAGPEEGVWVIAETKDLATGYLKIVVTGDDGRFVIPDLPSANYYLWVRGYGLRDSP